MTTPRLNRIFIVSGSSTQTVEEHILWGANARTDDAFLINTSAGGWYADLQSNRGAALQASVVLASGLVSFNPYLIGIQNPTVSPDGTNQIDVPSLRDTVSNMGDRLHWLRVTTPDAEGAYVQFRVLRIFSFVDAPMITVVEVDMPTLSGDDFTLGPTDYTQIQFQRHTHEVSRVSVMDRKAWGELTERGSALGVLDISTSDPTTTGSQEEGIALVRYESGLAVGESLTDDLGRVWTIEGSRTLEDRRYLEYSLTRMIGTAGG